MPIPKIPQEWGNRPPRVHFTYTGTPTGHRWQAWVAGPCLWVIAHTKGRTKPCLHQMTGGVLPCPRCAQIQPPAKIGYQPLYRMSDGKPVVVIVYEGEEQYTDRFTLHLPVQVAREAAESDTVFVREVLAARPAYYSTLSCRMVAADCTESLLAMWALPEWTAWCRGQRPAAAPPPPTKPAAAIDQSGIDPMYIAAHRRWTPVETPDVTAVEDAVQSAVDRAALRAAQSAPHKNGKLKPKQ